ncbi:hypothetical protein LCGC14_1359110 [marine sediment metagenome]|uniref:ClpX-type ZB domain-containing protein n=1 Tax=marine sediment metagenome TaxID=412755 RepID=A0A0F9KUP0_9ZZZZ
MTRPTFTCSECGTHNGLTLFKDAEICIQCYLTAVRRATEMGRRHAFMRAAESKSWVTALEVLT